MNPEDLEVLLHYMNEQVEPQYAFTEGEYADRKDKLVAEMQRRSLDVVLLASPESQCWLHGYQARWYRTGSTTAWPPVNFTAVAGDGTMILFDSADHERLIAFTSRATDVRFPEAADPSVAAVHDFVIGELASHLKPRAKWGIEKWSPRQNFATTMDLLERLNRHPIIVEDVSVSMRRLQRVKSEAELHVLTRASNILDNAYEHVQSLLHPQMTEAQVWAEMERAMARQGGETAALHNTVSRTRNYYHTLSSARRIGTGQLHFDPSSVLHRYHVNTARQFFLEDARTTAPRQLKDASKVAAEALHVLETHARPGVRFKELGSRLRGHYEKHGLWDLRDWIGGYQLGISFPPDWVGEFVWNVDQADEADSGFDTRDPEDMAAAQEKRVEENMVTNFESFVGGAGFIDTIIFTQRGIEVLSRTSPLLTTV